MKLHDEFFNEKAVALLALHGLNDFDALWSVKAEEVEPGNVRRGGWSNVGKLALTDEQGNAKVIYIKRQQNHSTRLLQYFLRKIPTLLKEWLAIARFQQAQVATVEPVYFAWRTAKEGHQAILVTWELKDYYPLDEYLKNWLVISWEKRQSIINEVALMISRMHQSGIQHNCLYTKHIFVNLQEKMIKVGIIDLEKCRHRVILKKIFNRDMSTLYKCTPMLSDTERVRFLCHYFEERKLSRRSRLIVEGFVTFLYKRAVKKGRIKTLV